MKEGRGMAGRRLGLGRYLIRMRIGRGDWRMPRSRFLLPKDGT